MATPSDNGAVAQNSASGAETNTIAGSSARRGYAQNQALNAASTSGTANQNAAPTMSANAGQSGAASATTMSSARANARDKSVVRAVQQALNDKGYNAGKVDGIWGPKTQSAVTKFQQSQGMTPTRSLDDQTLAALGVGSASPTRTSMQSSQRGSKPELASGQTKSQ